MAPSIATNATQWVGLLIAALVTVIIPWLAVRVSTFVDESISHIKDQRLKASVETLVKSAEQLFSDGDQRYGYVYNMVAKIVPGLDHPQIESLIQAAVLSLHTDLGTSHALAWNQQNQVIPTGVNLDALTQELTMLVAPSLGPEVTKILNAYLINKPPPAAPSAPSPSQ